MYMNTIYSGRFVQPTINKKIYILLPYIYHKYHHDLETYAQKFVPQQLCTLLQIQVILLAIYCTQTTNQIC